MKSQTIKDRLNLEKLLDNEKLNIFDNISILDKKIENL